ncbi:MAG: DUF922 domain-containing Zn-dependent protease [Chloroflexi bacterium]|nr:DUF922 domain-containing Zn-dependent protease [Chloroflexota bacterium]
MGGGATEVVGPPVVTNHALSASGLIDIASIMSGRSEAGKVGWSEEMSATGPAGKGMDTVSVVVKITLDMPTWDPPSSMLPLARAEWERWLGALQAHEQGHIELVHQVHDGIAAKIIGKSKPAADTLWANAQASLTTKSAAYDTRTGHGLKTGTVLNVKIETDELADEEKKEAAADKAATPNSATAGDVTEE